MSIFMKNNIHISYKKNGIIAVMLLVSAGVVNAASSVDLTVKER